MLKGLITEAGKLTHTMRGIIYLLVLTGCACAILCVLKDRDLFDAGILVASLVLPAIGGQAIQVRTEKGYEQKIIEPDSSGSA